MPEILPRLYLELSSHNMDYTLSVNIFHISLFAAPPILCGTT